MIDMKIGIPQPYLRFGGDPQYDPLTLEAPKRPLGSEGREVSLSNGDERDCYFIQPLLEDGSLNPLATDDDNPYGYPDKPRLTVPSNPMEYFYGQGTLMEFASDVPSGNSFLFVSHNGVAHNPMWLVCVGGKYKVKTEIYLNGSYIYCDGFDFSDSKEASPVINSGAIQLRAKNGANRMHHIMVRNCFGSGRSSVTGRGVASNSGFNATGVSANDRFTDIIYYNNEVEYFGEYQQTAENDFHAFSIGINLDYVWILNNKARRCGGDGVQLGLATLPVGDPRGPTNTFIAGNDFKEMGENAIDIKNSYKTVISGNKFHDMDPYTNVARAGVLFPIHDGAHHLWVINNDFYNGKEGIQCSGAGKLRVLGNTLHGLTRRNDESLEDQVSTYYGSGCAFRAYGAIDVAVVNNTFYDYDRGLTFPGGVYKDDSDGLYYPSTLAAHNNLFLGRREEDEYEISVESPQYLEMRNNMFSNHLLPFNSKMGGPKYTEPSEIPVTGATSSLVASSPINPDGTTPDNSPCVDAGMSIQPYLDEFALDFSEFGLEITADRWYFVINQGIAKDIGASETGGAFIPFIPISPSKPVIDVVADTLTWSLNSVNEDRVAVLKNDAEVLSLPAGTTSCNIAGMSSSVDEYKIESGNSTGASQSEAAVSDVVTVTPVVGNNVVDVTGRDFIAFRTLDSVGELASPISNTGGFFGVQNSKVSVEGTMPTSSGYVYTLGGDKNSLSGEINFNTQKTLEMNIIDSSNGGDPFTAELSFNDSKVYVNNSGGFQQNKVAISSDKNVRYSYTSTSDKSSACIGISSIVDIT